jgi:hypothetical protein
MDILRTGLAIGFFSLYGGTAQAQFPIVDISLQHDAGAGVLNIALRANDFDFDQLVSNLVFTVRWEETSAATLGFGSSAWCPAPNQALPIAPSAMATPGNGYHYRTYNAIGFTMLGDLIDDGGCEQALLANTWTVVYTIPINNDPGGTSYEIATDQFATDDNRLYYISLNGSNQTGSVFTISTAAVGDVSSNEWSAMTVLPNPSSGPFTINLPIAPGSTCRAELVDATGRIMRSWRITSPSTTVDSEGLPPGLYVVRAWTEAGVLTSPFVLEKP